jgi:hypothetical protein
MDAVQEFFSILRNESDEFSGMVDSILGKYERNLLPMEKAPDELEQCFAVFGNKYGFDRTMIQAFREAYNCGEDSSDISAARIKIQEVRKRIQEVLTTQKAQKHLLSL